MSTKKVIFTILVVLVLGVIALISYAFSFSSAQDDRLEINSFDDCVAAGFPVMESYPRKCRTSEGESFTENIDNEGEIIDRANINPAVPVGTSTNATSS